MIGSLRREQVGEARIRQLQTEIEHFKRLVSIKKSNAFITIDTNISGIFLYRKISFLILYILYYLGQAEGGRQSVWQDDVAI